jgi:hypothetical protein
MSKNGESMTGIAAAAAWVNNTLRAYPVTSAATSAPRSADMSAPPNITTSTTRGSSMSAIRAAAHALSKIAMIPAIFCAWRSTDLTRAATAADSALGMTMKSGSAAESSSAVRSCQPARVAGELIRSAVNGRDGRSAAR